MSKTWTLVLSRRVRNLAHHIKNVDALEIGDPVFVRRKHSPLARQSGKIADIAPGDAYGPYLVRFDNGLRFRYQRNELLPLASAAQVHEAEPALTENALH